jgi:ribosome-binding factor A
VSLLVGSPCTLAKSYMKSHRLARIGEVIREVASTTILFEVKDPRVKNVTVTRTEVSADLQHAKVYVSIMGSEKQQQLAMHGLQNSAGFIQSRVAKQLSTRFVPVILFVLDPGVKKSLEIARILAEENAKASSAVADADSVDTDEDDDSVDEDDSTEHPPSSESRTDLESPSA